MRRIENRRRGIGCIRVNLSNIKIFIMYIIFALLFLIPFIIVDFVFYLDYSFAQSELCNYHRNWALNDGAFQSILLLFILLISFMRCERPDFKQIILSIFGILMQLYFVFQVPWLIVQANDFWNHVEPDQCGSLGEWISARLILGFILIVIGLFIYSIRPRTIEIYRYQQVNRQQNRLNRLQMPPAREPIPVRLQQDPIPPPQYLIPPNQAEEINPARVINPQQPAVPPYF